MIQQNTSLWIQRHHTFSRNINKMKQIIPNPTNYSIFDISSISATTQISLLLILKNWFWKFSFKIFFLWRRNCFCHYIFVALNISSHTSAYRFSLRIVLLVVQRIMIFGLVVIEKKAIIFFIIVVLLFSSFFNAKHYSLAKHHNHNTLEQNFRIVPN